MSEADYRLRFQKTLAQSDRASSRIVFLGDSLTQLYESSQHSPGLKLSYMDIWERFYGDRKAVNFGFNGDTTANVLWRLDHGELDGLQPKLVVLLIGSNNTRLKYTATWSASEDIRGIDSVVNHVHNHNPRAKILLVGLLPLRGSPHGLLESTKYKIKNHLVSTINKGLFTEFGGGKVPYVTYADISCAFMNKGGIDATLYVDLVHPTALGQLKIAMALEQPISQILGDTPKTDPVSISTTCRGPLFGP